MERSTRISALALALVALVNAPLYAVTVSGIAAVAWQGWDTVGTRDTRTLRIFRVTNSRLDSTWDVVAKGSSAVNQTDLVGYPVINTHGTHVAYWRNTATYQNPQYRLTVARIDQPTRTADLVLTGKDMIIPKTGYSIGSLAWPQGDWIYFSSAQRYRYMYRVNVQTRAIEFVTPIDTTKMVYGDGSGANTAWEWKMSAIGNCVLINQTGLVFTLQSIRAVKGVPNYAPWDSGGMLGLDGCGQTISPSGTLGGWQGDAGHSMYVVTALDWNAHRTSQVVVMDAETRNRWSVDKTDPRLACALSKSWPEPYVESVGVGNDTWGNTWSVNSDRWVCLNTGWAPGGRFGNNGRNLIIVDFRDSVSMNVTRGPRVANDMFGTIEAQCYTQSHNYYAEEFSFFVTAPVDHILPGLQADAASNYTVPGIDDNTQFPALTMMQQTPDGGWPIAVVPHEFSAVSGTADVTVELRGGACGTPVLRVCPGPTSTGCAVEGVDARGRTLVRKTGASGPLVIGLRDGLRHGWCMVRVSAGNRTMTKAVAVP